MSEWKPIEKEPKKIKEGFKRIYTFKPSTDGRYKLDRLYDFTRVRGHRECDFYMDIPEVSDV